MNLDFHCRLIYKMNALIIRFGELSLKGKNRAFFVRRLIKNISAALSAEGLKAKIEQKRHRIVLMFQEGMEAAVPILQRVFGISSLSLVEIVGTDILENAVLRYVKSLGKAESFRVTVQRLSKKFPMTSVELERHLGALVQEQTNWPVNLSKPGLTLRVEIWEGDTAVLFTEKIPGAGGLPVGVEGKVICLTGSGQERDLVTAWLCLKRGCEIALAGNEEVLAECLKRHAYGSNIKTHTLTSPEELSKLLETLHAKGIATGASASDYPELQEDLFILAPLTGFSNEEIRELADRIRQG